MDEAVVAHRFGDVIRDPNAVILYTTHRHWYEFVPELAEALWWCTIISLIDVTLIHYFGWYAVALLLLCIFPLAPAMLELYKWINEEFVVFESQGKVKLGKRTQSLIGKRGAEPRNWVSDPVNDFSPNEETTRWSRFVGFCWTSINSKNRTYIEGQRVPIELMRRISTTPKRREIVPTGSFDLLMENLLPWVQQGLITPQMARRTAAQMIEETI